MLALAVLAFSAATAWAQSDAKVDPALEATNKKFTEAFNAFDAKAVASFFAADGTLINPVGNVAHGPEEIAKVFAEDAARFFKGSTSTFTITGAREVGPDTMWLDLDHTAKNARQPDGKTGEMKMHVVMLVQKQGDEWKYLEARPYAFVPMDHAHSGAKGNKAPAGKKAPAK
jgi:uncharacterized protein (TIGR02246 family)